MLPAGMLDTGADDACFDLLCKHDQEAHTYMLGLRKILDGCGAQSYARCRMFRKTCRSPGRGLAGDSDCGLSKGTEEPTRPFPATG